jgi:hypothetical protein
VVALEQCTMKHFAFNDGIGQYFQRFKT